MQGEAGTATQILREKTYHKLVSAFTPKVDEKLNEFGIVRAINNVTSANSMLGSLLGNEGGGTTSNSLSQYATEQMVTGLFHSETLAAEERVEMLRTMILTLENFR